MGRPRKPTALKILDGDRKDRINTAEPKSPPGLGDHPAWFDDHAALAWSWLKDRLDPMGVATRADEGVAIVFCQAFSTLRQAVDVVREHGAIVESVTEIQTKSGSISRSTLKANPLLPAMQQAERQMMACLMQLGMSPTSRAALKVQGKPEEDPVLAFFAKSKKTDGNHPKPKPRGKAKA